MLVTKRDGSKQELDLAKIHEVVQWACKGDEANSLDPIKGVSESEIEMKAHLLFYEGIRTKDIHECLIKAASDLISEDRPNYDQAAARLRWFAVRKEAFGTNTPPDLITVIKRNTALGLYDPAVEGMYSEQEWGEINSMIDHNRDDLFKFAGAEQMATKYLAQNRKTKQIYESFQFPYIMVAAILFHAYPKEIRLKYVERFYDAVSLHYLNLPTPIMAGLRTRVKQFSSCTLIETGDSLDSINASAKAIVEYASRKAGIGLNVGRIRAQGQPVRGGDAVTTGMIPFMKYFAAALKSCSQGAVRGASATFNYPAWHLEFENVIELKNSKGTEETRLRTVDYCVHLNRTLYERLVRKQNVTLFSPDEVPDLYEAFYGPSEKFGDLYKKYEQDASKTRKTMSAMDMFSKIGGERSDTGRIYVMNADTVNEQSPFLEPVTMTNLCTEITLPTRPMGSEDSRIALCTLAAANWGKIKTRAQMNEVCELAVRGLDALLDYQEYPNEAARAATMEYRPLGIGIIGFAHFLAKNHAAWGSEEALGAVENRMEEMALALTKTSMTLAKEKGAEASIKRTRYHEGWVPFDNAKDSAILSYPEEWDELRENLKKYGIRNATLMAMMPSETSSVLSNETNGIEPPKSLVTIKGNKESVMPQVVPDFAKLSHVYELAWDVPVKAYLRTIAVLQKYTDQAISANTTYNPIKNEVKMSEVIEDILLAYKLGIKTLYYHNTYDGAGEEIGEDDGCESGACKI